jgi:hypothetical protein
MKATDCGNERLPIARLSCPRGGVAQVSSATGEVWGFEGDIKGKMGNREKELVSMQCG